MLWRRSRFYCTITITRATASRWHICVFKHTQLPIVAPPCLDPGLTIKRALNAGYQGLGTIHWNNQLINFKRFSLFCQANDNTFVFNSEPPSPFLINKLSINHVWSLFTGCSAVGRGRERLLGALIGYKQPKHASVGPCEQLHISFVLKTPKTKQKVTIKTTCYIFHIPSLSPLLSKPHKRLTKGCSSMF